jgi:hypothetical protein
LTLAPAQRSLRESISPGAWLRLPHFLMPPDSSHGEEDPLATPVWIFGLALAAAAFVSMVSVFAVPGVRLRLEAPLFALAGTITALVLVRRGRANCYLSGYAENSTLQRAGLEAGSALLIKPFMPSELLRRVRGMLDE